jgi:hypothetical protein
VHFLKSENKITTFGQLFNLNEFSVVAQIPTSAAEPKIEIMGNAPLCQVCQSGPSNGLHFGAPRTCAACAGKQLMQFVILPLF